MVIRVRVRVIPKLLLEGDEVRAIIDVECRDSVGERREIVATVYVDQEDLFPDYDHVHLLDPEPGSRAKLWIDKKLSSPGKHRIIVDVRLCEVVDRRPPLKSKIVRHGRASRFGFVRAVDRPCFAELLPGGGLQLASTGPRLRKRGSVVCCNDVLLKKVFTVYVFPKSSRIGRALVKLYRSCSKVLSFTTAFMLRVTQFLGRVFKRG